MILARLPRVQCTKRGVTQVAMPSVEPQGRFIFLFEPFAQDALRATQSVKNDCTILNIF